MFPENLGSMSSELIHLGRHAMIYSHILNLELALEETLGLI